MPTLFVDEQDAQWFTVDIPPFNGDVSVKVRAADQPLLDRVKIAAKKNPNSKPRHEAVNGKRTLVPADPATAWSEEFVREVLEDFAGVEDRNGDVVCTDETKLVVMRSAALVRFIVEKSSLLAQVRVEDERGNFDR